MEPEHPLMVPTESEQWTWVGGNFGKKQKHKRNSKRAISTDKNSSSWGSKLGWVGKTWDQNTKPNKKDWGGEWEGGAC